MKTAKQLLMMWVATVVCVSAAFAGPPLVGTYKSPGGGADLIVGRHSESWPGPAGFRTFGNAINAASYDGALGTQWSYTCPTVVAAIETFDTRNVSGTGLVGAFITYTPGGASFLLAGAGAWANGDVDYPGVIETFIMTTFESWLANERTGVTETMTMTGYFIGPRYPCFKWVANGAQVSSTDAAALPADFPAFLAGFTCVASPTFGNWSTQDDITFDIIGDCIVSTHDTTWGAIKELYRD